MSNNTPAQSIAAAQKSIQKAEGLATTAQEWLDITDRWMMLTNFIIQTTAALEQ